MKGPAMNYRSIVAFSVIFCLSGCGQKDSTESKISALEKRIGALEKTAAGQQKTLDQQKITNQFTAMELADVFDSPASVDTTTKNFSVAHNQYGAFTVAVTKLEPYLDGYKVTLNIGNLSNVTYTGATFKIDWGHFGGYGQEKQFTEPGDVLPGRYTQHEFALTPAKADEVKTINVSIDFSGTRLLVPLEKGSSSSSGPPASAPDRQPVSPQGAANITTTISKCVASVHSAAPADFNKTYYEGFDAYYNQATGMVTNNATRVGDEAPLYLFQKCMATAGLPLK